MKQPSAPAGSVPARVIAAHGRRLTVLTDDGRTHGAEVFGRGLQVVCGDRVTCRHDVRHDAWHVLAVLPRRSVLHRSNLHGRSEPVAANVDLLLVVLAAVPATDPFVIDRYLAAAASAPAEALLVLNKADLPLPETLQAELATWRAAGIAQLACSTRDDAGLTVLRTRLQGHTALMVGQSGVGKSSLLRALLPGNEARVGELMRGNEGRHTTTATTLHALPDGGELLDSPGVRDFAPALERLEPRALGFVEFAPLVAACRFADCRHYDEPDCAVRAAVAAGQCSARRYESYRRLRRLYEDHCRRLRSGGR